MNKNFKFLVFSFFSFVASSYEVSAKNTPSFDCAKATTDVEKIKGEKYDQE